MLPILYQSVSVAVPVWLISVMMSILTAAVVAWGVISTIRAKVERSTKDIECLRKEKIARDEFNLVISKLNSIEEKLDKHIQNDT